MKGKFETINSLGNIHIGIPFNSIDEFLNGRNALFILDSNVLNLYKDMFERKRVIDIGNGENIKNLNTAEALYSMLLDEGVDKSWIIVGVGGGVITDLTGFVASTFMRGIPFAFVPTTLLAQVDASIGGKNGIDFKGYKNMIGTIKQPEFCLIDTNFLKTIPENQFRSGLAEVVKSAIIADRNLFQTLEMKDKQIIDLHQSTIEQLISETVRIKVSIVERDQFENLERMKLNFGHSIGHAIELVKGIPHGMAVSIGMVVESKISLNRGILDEDEYIKIKTVLSKFGLPTEIRADKSAILEALMKDKKKRGEKIGLTIIEGIGQSHVEMISIDEVVSTVKEISQ